jgi:PAS domain S-box-containing protein
MEAPAAGSVNSPGLLTQSGCPQPGNSNRSGTSDPSVQSEHCPALDEASPIALYVLQKGQLRHVNRWFATSLGYERPGELIGMALRCLVHPDDLRHVRLVPPGKGLPQISGGHEFRMLKKDGRSIWVQMAGTITNYGGLPASVGYLIDVSANHYRLENLQESLQRYESILDDVDVQLSEIDFDGNVTFINDAGCRIWGLPREALMALNYRAYVHPKIAEKFIEIYKEVYRTGLPKKNLVMAVRDKDDRLRTIEKSVSPIRNADGNISGFRMVTRDISDRVEAENRLNEHRSRLEAIFGSVKDAIITVDPDQRVIEVNRSTETICGIAAKDLTGNPFSQCPTSCGQSCREVLRHTLDKKIAIKDHLIECDHQQRLHQVVSVSSSPLLGAKGEFMGAVMVIRDITLLRDLKRELRQRNQFQNIIGRNKTMQDIYHLLEDLANLNTTVLVTGESGTGKELVARALHFSGNRAFKPFITVNCSALSENLLESELFGHVKGAFTGAVQDKQGRFQAADGGTILLDEIGDISAAMQMKLLRVLQEKEFERVGESTPRKVDVRVIACTNKDLKEKVRLGQFRQDLYYRLKVVEVTLPPLRKRMEDVPLLVEHFQRVFNERFQKKVEGISGEVLGVFMEYPWPGNVRELEHVMEHAFVLCHGGAITLKHLPADIRKQEILPPLSCPKIFGAKSITPLEIMEALKRSDGNKAKAARLLGIGRRTIYRKIEEYQLG